MGTWGAPRKFSKRSSLCAKHARLCVNRRCHVKGTAGGQTISRGPSGLPHQRYSLNVWPQLKHL